MRKVAGISRVITLGEERWAGAFSRTVIVGSSRSGHRYHIQGDAPVTSGSPVV